MIAEIIAVGSELTTGQKLDTNSQWLSLQLADLGIDVRYHTTVADDLAANVAVLRAAAERVDVVIITGGLGPTLDDLTREALAATAGVDLVLHEPSLAFIEEFFRNRGREMPARNRTQALFPVGSVPLPNPVGTAPGVWMEVKRGTGSGVCLFAALPGVPSEMRPMFLEQVRPRLPGGAAVIRRARINCFGLGESAIEQLLGDLTARGRQPEVGITAHDATITLRIVAQGSAEAECVAGIEQTVAEIRRRLGHYVFGIEDEELEHVVIRRLLDRGATLATAEAGTGGLIAQRLSAVDGFETCYLAGLVVPNDAARRALLGMEMSGEAAAGEEMARMMAVACRHRFETTYALAVAPRGLLNRDEAMTSPATVWIALATGDGVSSQAIALGGDPAILRSRLAKAGLDLLRLRLD